MSKNKAPAPTLEDKVRKWYRSNGYATKRIQVNATIHELLKFCYWHGDELYFNDFYIESTHLPKLTRKQYEKQQQKI